MKGLVQQALNYLDSEELWDAPSVSMPDGYTFPAELLTSICDALKPHDYQTALGMNLQTGFLSIFVVFFSILCFEYGFTS